MQQELRAASKKNRFFLDERENMNQKIEPITKNCFYIAVSKQINLCFKKNVIFIRVNL